jgi:hypothetical protein
MANHEQQSRQIIEEMTALKARADAAVARHRELEERTSHVRVLVGRQQERFKIAAR